MMPYWWDECDCGADERGEDCSPGCILNKPNFIHKTSGLEIKWYKYPFRDSYSNREFGVEEFASIVSDCINSLLRSYANELEFTVSRLRDGLQKPFDWKGGKVRWNNMAASTKEDSLYEAYGEAHESTVNGEWWSGPVIADSQDKCRELLELIMKLRWVDTCLATAPVRLTNTQDLTE